MIKKVKTGMNRNSNDEALKSFVQSVEIVANLA